jgi:gluconokinase
MRTDPGVHRLLGVVVMGVSGSGKSTLGRALADALAAPFLEGDDYHPPANVAKMSAGIALQDGDRWPWLDALGLALGDAVRRHEVAVCACSALKRAYRDRLRAQSDVPILLVCLSADPALIRRRMAMRPGHFMPASLLDSQLATLELPDATEDAMIFNHDEAPDAILRGVTDRIKMTEREI